MSSVQAYYLYNNGNTELIGVYDGDRIKAHSALIRNETATQEPHPIQRVSLQGPTFESLQIVLREINNIQQGEVLLIKIKTRDIKKAINIHSAIRYLQVEPEQTLVVGHFHGYLSKQIVNPDEMVAIYLHYGNPANRFHSIFVVMIQNIAHSFVHNQITDRQCELLKEAALRYPEIDAAIHAKVVNERRNKQAKEEREKQEAEMADGRMSRRAAKKTAWKAAGKWR